MHQFINMNSVVKFHQDLQSKRISRDLNDIQAIMNLLKETMINPVEEKPPMSISSEIFSEITEYKMFSFQCRVRYLVK